jgi:hypothetical protein
LLASPSPFEVLFLSRPVGFDCKHKQKRCGKQAFFLLWKNKNKKWKIKASRFSLTHNNESFSLSGRVEGIV